MIPCITYAVTQSCMISTVRSLSLTFILLHCIHSNLISFQDGEVHVMVSPTTYTSAAFLHMVLLDVY